MGQRSQKPVNPWRRKSGLWTPFVWLRRVLAARKQPSVIRFGLAKSKLTVTSEVRALLRRLALDEPVPVAIPWPTLVEALELSASENAYDSTAALVSDALPRLGSCPKTLRKRVLRRTIDSLAARGEGSRIAEVLAAYRQELPKTGYAPEFFGESGGASVTSFEDRHAVYRALRDGRLSPLLVVDRLGADPATLREAPPLELLLFYGFRRLGNSGAAASALARYLRAEGLDPLSLAEPPTDNVLSTLQAKRTWLRRGRHGRGDGPLVSIVCSAYRAESTLDYAVRSLLAQTHENLELLLCDDGSDDGTFAVATKLAKADSRIRLFRSKGNQGTYNVRNCLIPLARGTYVTFHDGDDYALPVRLETQLLALKETTARACVANWLRILPDGLVVFFRDGKEKRLSIVSLMVERDLLMGLLPYRSARHSADLELYERLLSEVGQGAVARVTAPLLFGLWSSQSLTRGAGSEALENGYRAPARRRYAELCFRQRLLGVGALPDRVIDDELRAMGNYLEPQGVEEVCVTAG